MVLEFFRSRGHDPIEGVEATLVSMLRDACLVYRTATDAVFGAGKSKEAKRTVRTTDREINRGQGQVRQALMVHGAVQGSAVIDLPLVLAYMSVVKDVERVGDYAKNVYDLARYGADLTEGPDAEALAAARDRVGAMIDQAADIFAEADKEAAVAFISEGDALLDEFDAGVREAHASQGKASDAVARALFYRFLKRIIAHLMNLIGSLILPVDQLDYFDEVKEDR